MAGSATACRKISEGMSPESAINDRHGSRDIAGPGRKEKSRCIGNVLRNAKIAQRDLLFSELPALVRREDATDIFRVDQTRLEAVDPDTILTQLTGQLLGPDGDGGLGNGRAIDGT